LDQPSSDVYNAINAVRTRAGIDMPPLSGLSKEQLRERIRNERRIEFAFEGKRFYDLRRWRIGFNSTTQNGVMLEASGLEITLSNGVKTYQKKPIQSRTYDKRFDLFPIPQIEMQRHSALDQNPDYD
jgi:hypothetical protein